MPVFIALLNVNTFARLKLHWPKKNLKFFRCFYKIFRFTYLFNESQLYYMPFNVKNTSTLSNESRIFNLTCFSENILNIIIIIWFLKISFHSNHFKHTQNRLERGSSILIFDSIWGQMYALNKCRTF